MSLPTGKPLPPGTVTFLFTDVEGSTRLWEEYPRSMPAILARHDALAEDVMTGHGGTLVKSRGEGDSLFAVFARATDALAAACAFQHALVGERWPIEDAIKVRMALHTGEADLRDGDYYGAAVNRCARLRAVAHGGQVLLSEITQALVQDHLPHGVELKDFGMHRLKDLGRPEHIFGLLHPDLPKDFPPLRSLDARPNNLPLQLSSFVGREAELAEIADLLTQTRLLTLTGAGGSGKTRLALQAAAERLDDFTDGVFLVELAALSEPTLLVDTVAQALGVRETPGRSLLDSLTENLRPRTLLLVLDNCEHLVEPCARLAESLLRACPALRVLATSRERFQISGEKAWAVPPLAVPRTGSGHSVGEIAEFPSVALFVQRAQAVLPSFALSEDNAAAVAQICRSLDGIPLALELAAVRVGVLAPGQIALRLGDVFRLLTKGSRTGLTHHQTLRAMVDWSYHLLEAPEQRLLQRLSVFAGGWTLEAAEAVGAEGETEAEDVLDLLDTLVQKSLVQTEDADENSRYRLLETLRQYGEEKLRETGDLEEARRRHGVWFLTMVEGAAPRVGGADQAEWFDRLEIEHDNLRAALTGIGDPAQGLRLASALHRFWMVRGHLSEGRRWLEKALAAGTGAPAAPRANALNAAGILALVQGDYETAHARCTEGLELYRQLADRAGVAACLSNLGRVADEQGDWSTASARYTESYSIYEEMADKNRMAQALLNLGCIASDQGDYEGAESRYRHCLSLWREMGNLWLTATALHNLGSAARAQGKWNAARPFLQESLRLRQQLDDKLGLVQSLEEFTRLLHAQGQSERGVRLFFAAQAVRETLGTPLPPMDHFEAQQEKERLAANLGPERFAQACMQGRRMSIEQAVLEALASPE